MTAEEIEQIKRESFERGQREGFIEGYVTACREWTSGQIAAVSLAYKAWEKRKTS